MAAPPRPPARNTWSVRSVRSSEIRALRSEQRLERLVHARKREGESAAFRALRDRALPREQQALSHFTEQQLERKSWRGHESRPMHGAAEGGGELRVGHGPRRRDVDRPGDARPLN